MQATGQVGGKRFGIRMVVVRRVCGLGVVLVAACTVRLSCGKKNEFGVCSDHNYHYIIHNQCSAGCSRDKAIKR